MSALNKKVLVVDDDPVVSKSMDRVLTDRGYVVITARNGEDAIAKLANEEYDVVFTDIRMPGMDGIEVAKQIKTRRPWVPVVIITGYGTANNEARAKEAGVSAFLRKPLSPEMIEDSARDALLDGAREAAAAVAAQIAPAHEVTPANEEHVEHHHHGALRNLGMLLAAPFIGLFFVLTLPLVGLATLAWKGVVRFIEVEASDVPHSLGARLSMLVVGPLLGLVYVIALPFAGLATLAWMGLRHVRE